MSKSSVTQCARTRKTSDAVTEPRSKLRSILKRGASFSKGRSTSQRGTRDALTGACVYFFSVGPSRFHSFLPSTARLASATRMAGSIVPLARGPSSNRSILVLQPARARDRVQVRHRPHQFASLRRRRCPRKHAMADRCGREGQRQVGIDRTHTMKSFLPPPKWAVPVRVPFVTLVLSRACRLRTAWLLSHGALTSPLHQDCILKTVQAFRTARERFFGNVWDAITLPFALWR